MNVNYDPKSQTVTVSFKYDPSKHGSMPLSKSSGKTRIVGTTGGFVGIPGTVAKVSITATVPADAE